MRPTSSDRPPRAGRGAGGYATALVRGRWAVVATWLGLVVVGLLLLPPAGSSGGSLSDLLPSNSAALAAQERSLRSFDVPLSTGTVLVIHDPAGLHPLTIADIALYAAATDQRLSGLSAPYPNDRVLGALPIINPRDRTTAITFLYFSPSAGLGEQQRLAQEYATHFHSDPGVRTYLTGLVPAQNAQNHYLVSSLPLVEATTLALVLVLVAATFRSVLAPLLTVGAAGLAFVTDERLLGWLGRRAGFSFPSQLEPLIIALLLGVVTDYTVFFLSGFRDRLAAGDPPQAAIRTAIRENAPIVSVAGLTVAAGCAALYAAPMKTFRAFGPGLAITVVVGAITAVTLIPAALALLGPAVFWPTHPRPAGGARRTARRRPLERFAAVVSRRGPAAGAAAVCVLALGATALPVLGLRLSLSFSATLPPSSPVRQGVQVMTSTYPRGITAPTELLVEGPGVTGQRAALAALQRQVARQPGVAQVYGPEDSPLPDAHGIMLSTDRRTARLVVLFDHDPLGARAAADLRTLQHRSASLARAAGFRHVRLSYAGGTAIAAEVATDTRESLKVVLLAALAVELALLAVYLRSALAPIYLLACSALTVAAALGLSVIVFQWILGVPGLTFYVPFASAVLLLALGSDYTIFGVGSIWEHARARPLAEAVRYALPRSSRAITAAGLTLAGSFALVALVPLLTFAELAFTVAAGLLIDTFLVRTVLTPSLITLAGPVSQWPGVRRGRREPTTDLPSPAAVSRTSTQSHTGTVSSPRRLPHRRLLTEVLVAIVLLAGIAFGLDWTARLAAQSLIARSIQHTEHLASRPEVHVRGWLFLPHVVTGNYPRVDLTVHDIRHGSLRIKTATASATGVHVPLHDIVTGHLPAVLIDDSHETATLTYADLNAYLRAEHTPVVVSRGPAGELTLTAQSDLPGIPKLSASADAVTGHTPGYLLITPTQLHTGTVVDPVTRRLLNRRLTLEIPTSPLPFGQQVTAIRPTAEGLDVTARGHHLVITSQSEAGGGD